MSTVIVDSAHGGSRACSGTCSVCGERWPASLERCPHDGQLLVVVDEAPANALTIGTKVGDYVITTLLASTGMSTVYAAVHPLIGKRVAIKVIAAELCAQRDAVLRFVQEARAVNKIRHPNIVDIFTFGTLGDGRCYFVMEWLQGETLSQRLCDDQLGFDEKLAIAGQMCAALAAVHAAGVVHRDLKPDNVFLVPDDGEQLRVKLLDFGIAKLAAGEGVAPTLTNHGETMGTPAYVSPEQAKGDAVGVSSDVYGLGVVLYEMFLGRPPFVADSDTQVIAMHVTETPLAPSLLWENVPVELERLLVGMLDKTADHRPHIAEVRTRLQRIRRAAAASAEPIVDELHMRVRALFDAPPPSPRRRRARVVAVVLLGLAALAVTAELASGDDPATAPSTPSVAAATPAAAPGVAPPEPSPVIAAPPPAAAATAPTPAPGIAPTRRPAPRRRRASATPVDERSLVDPFASAPPTPVRRAR